MGLHCVIGSTTISKNIFQCLFSFRVIARSILYINKNIMYTQMGALFTIAYIEQFYFTLSLCVRIFHNIPDSRNAINNSTDAVDPSCPARVINTHVFNWTSYTKLMRLEVTNLIVDDLDFKPVNFDSPFGSDSKSNDGFESTIAISI